MRGQSTTETWSYLVISSLTGEGTVNTWSCLISSLTGEGTVYYRDMVMVDQFVDKTILLYRLFPVGKVWMKCREEWYVRILLGRHTIYSEKEKSRVDMHRQ